MFSLFSLFVDVDIFDEPAQPAVVLHAAAWPRARFATRAIACHPAIWPAAFVAERYAVHELRLGVDDTDGAACPGLTRAAYVGLAHASFLGSDREFQAGGLRDLSVDCRGVDASGPAGARDRCATLLLGADGQRALRCLPGVAAEPLLALGGPWRSLAAGPGEDEYWVLGERSVVQLRPRAGSGGRELAPSMELPVDAATAGNLTQLHVLHHGAVLLGLERRGRVHAWPLRGGRRLSWQLPAGVDWAGVCAAEAGDTLHLVGQQRATHAAAVWRVELPGAETYLRGVGLGSA